MNLQPLIAIKRGKIVLSLWLFIESRPVEIGPICGRIWAERGVG
jgi:hypothetical protein